MGFKWPRPTGCKPLSLLVDPCSATDREQPQSNTEADENLKRLQQDLVSQGVPLRSVPFALDIFSSNHVGRATADKVPCLTCSRAKCGGYWITTVGGLLTNREMLRLQGLPEHLEAMAAIAGVSDRQLREMIGNAMSMNVLVVLLGQLLPAMGLARVVVREP